MNRFDMFEKAHRDSVITIQEYLKDPDMAKFTNWLMTTDADLYQGLPKEWYGISSSIDCASFLHHVHHALVDDGEISFIGVAGISPRIAFTSEHNFVDDSPTKNQQAEYVFYNVDQFIEQVELWTAQQRKRHFIADAARFGISHARTHYTWVTDEHVERWQTEINQRISLINGLNIN